MLKFTLKNIRERVNITRMLSYVQGQEPEPKIREYFYSINHEGMLFLDDAKMKNFTSCFKDKKFLRFFFRQLKENRTNRYENEFPYVSLCGQERNFVRCEYLPIVYTHVLPPINENDSHRLSYSNVNDLLTVNFEPNRLYMSPSTGRVYHPAHERYGSIGLVRSKLAIEFSKYFEFDGNDNDPPVRFNWNGIKYDLDRDWIKTVRVKCDL